MREREREVEREREKERGKAVNNDRQNVRLTNQWSNIRSRPRGIFSGIRDMKMKLYNAG